LRYSVFHSLVSTANDILGCVRDKITQVLSRVDCSQIKYDQSKNYDQLVTIHKQILHANIPQVDPQTNDQASGNNSNLGSKFKQVREIQKKTSTREKINMQTEQTEAKGWKNLTFNIYIIYIYDIKSG